MFYCYRYFILSDFSYLRHHWCRENQTRGWPGQNSFKCHCQYTLILLLPFRYHMLLTQIISYVNYFLTHNMTLYSGVGASHQLAKVIHP